MMQLAATWGGAGGSILLHEEGREEAEVAVGTNALTRLIPMKLTAYFSFVYVHALHTHNRPWKTY